MQFVIENGILRRLIAPYSTRQVQIPEEVTVIGEGALEGFGMLESVTLPPNLTEIGARAFRGCGMLKRLAPKNFSSDCFYFPMGLTTLKDEALMRCHKMQTLLLPTSLTIVGSRVTRECGNLKKIWLFGHGRTDIFRIVGISPFGIRRSDWYVNIVMEDFTHAETPEELLLIARLHSYGADKAEDWIVSHAEAFFGAILQYPDMLAWLSEYGALKSLIDSDRIAAEIPPELLDILVQDANSRRDYETQLRLTNLGQKSDSPEQFRKHFQL